MRTPTPTTAARHLPAAHMDRTLLRHLSSIERHAASGALVMQERPTRRRNKIASLNLAQILTDAAEALDILDPADPTDEAISLPQERKEQPQNA